MLDTLATALVFIGAVPATLFPLLYSRSPWRKSVVGHALMIKAVGLALLVDLTALTYVFGTDYLGRDLVRVAVFTIIVTGLWTQLYALIRARRTHADTPPEDVP